MPTRLALALALAAWSAAGSAQAPSFDEFLAGVRSEALAQGISAGTVEAAFAGLTPQPVVVQRDRTQPEQTLSLDQYVARRTTARTVTTGRTYLDRHGNLLRKVEGAYGVPPAVVVAIWGLESNFGRFTGTYPTVRALATLAYDGRRPLFRRELLHALAILDRGDVPPDRLRGSWAGAMGQPQFMPSSFLERAVDFDGDGRVDIWTSVPDVFASMANYLQAAGWTAGVRWGREVAVPRAALARIEETVPMRREGCRAVQQMTVPRPLAAWSALGVTVPGGGALPAATVDASLVRGEKRHFLVYRNYEALLSYNCSNAYAVSVGILADRIAVR
jgi:membrane-bound lytic murein transglycosylase B